jgi:sortase A
VRIKDVTLSLMSLALIGAGATLIATFFLGYGTSSNSSDESEGFVAPVLQDSDTQASEESSGVVSAPEDETLWLTVPKMTRIFNTVVPNAEGNDEEKLRDYAAIHLEGTGFPWQRGANVYIAGHRLGFPDTSSFLAFYDLDKLEDGDPITVADADGREYTYEVFRKAVVGPTDFSITEPVEGRDVLTLQTCTLPDYSQRLAVQAEKVV